MNSETKNNKYRSVEIISISTTVRSDQLLCKIGMATQKLLQMTNVYLNPTPMIQQAWLSNPQFRLHRSNNPNKPRVCNY